MKKTRPPTVPCKCCHGTGRVELTGVYAETLRWMQQHDRPVVANQMAYLFGCKPTALSNRLARLEEMGFLTSEHYGREHRYSLATPPQVT